MIKAFLFDYDGVMTAGVKDGIPASRLAKNVGVSFDTAAGWIASIWAPFSTGMITENQAWDKLENLYGNPISTQQRDIWFKWAELEPLPEMINLVRLLKTRGYPVGVLSNVLPVTAQVIREHNGYAEFDFTVLSCEVGSRKPDQKVYETALTKLKDVAPQEVAFLDDREPCTTAASKLGLLPIHVTNHSEAIQQVLTLIDTV
ncbi:MAG: hypothetical protein JWM81_1182 [Candidatus Saccharibacteria bacterium]|nr:hypothetical protein [Candidatus Saccharibacteria bacterium]